MCFPILEAFLQIQMFMLLAALWNLWSCMWQIHFLVWYGKCLELGGRAREYEGFPVESFLIQKLHPIEIVQELSVYPKMWEAQGKAADNVLFV